ncbi:MAG TPA: hypothetical protein EYO89_02690 [Candidatus Dadabacteria bacterium]|jgi:hypothetical protein|nr:hypothetical protein [Candidatus Dadabacteria bacterium]|tara:strand:+ start:36 stop:239 length:204 start_codon:yes stop_codon:yes gene_type:complete
MQKQNLTLKVLSEKANCAPFIVKYLYSCRRLPVIKESLGSGYPVIFHPDAINIVKAHLNKAQPELLR